MKPFNTNLFCHKMFDVSLFLFWCCCQKKKDESEIWEVVFEFQLSSKHDKLKCPVYSCVKVCGSCAAGDALEAFEGSILEYLQNAIWPLNMAHEKKLKSLIHFMIVTRVHQIIAPDVQHWKGRSASKTCKVATAQNKCDKFNKSW